ncbi:hypothetical protein [Trinickia mobilis]|uniref:hypothetical protein n=1 Tax=Trinickia mobilis TaxID=2816356 RepID=UPI001A90BB7C|nr:hypothetical protein [Trinickia mobilis]
MPAHAKHNDIPYHQTLPPLHPVFANDEGAQAAYRLFGLCGRHIGGSTNAIAAFLVGLYNPSYAPGDPAYLCRWSNNAVFEDVVKTMRWTRAKRQYEIHHIFARDRSKTMDIFMQRFEFGPFRRRAEDFDSLS